MRKFIAAAAFFVALSASAGTITSIDHTSIPMRSGEYFMTVTGTGLGNQFVYDGGMGRIIVNANSDDGLGHVTAWIPMEIVNSPGTYSLFVRGTDGDSNAVTFYVTKPGASRFALHLPDALVATARSLSGTGIKYEVSVTGGDGSGTAECSPASGSIFPYGTSWIKCSATDLSGARASGTIQVTVWDGAAPSITVPASFEVASDDGRGSYVKFETSAYDAIDGALHVTCAPSSGTYFPNGRTAVNCEAVDAALNPAYGSFEVMVRPRDTGYLKLEVPAGIYAKTPGGEEAIVEYTVNAYGSADPDPVITCTPASGNPFPIGKTWVSCTATDDFDNRAENGFGVAVERGDSLGLKSVTAEASSPEGATVEYDTPETGETLKCSHASGSVFAIGTTSVSCEAGALRGSFDVTVKDTVAPHIAGARAIPGAADGDQRVHVQVEVDATDAADAMPQCSVSAIEGGEGRVVSDLVVSLRNEREADREFRLQVSCVDKAGNRTTEAVPVRLGPVGRRRAATN